MLLDICLGNRTSWKILILIAQSPGKAITRQQIKKHTKIGNKALVKFLGLLKNFDILIENKHGKEFNYKMNLANPFSTKLLEIIELEKKQLNNPYFNSLTVLREFVYELTNIKDSEFIKKVILFGSVAKHTATTNSDIDIAIVTLSKNPGIELQTSAICSKIQERFNKEIQVHFFTEDEIKKKSTMTEDIARDGIRLL